MDERAKSPMITVTMRLTAEMLTELKQTASIRQLGGYQPLIREYITAGLRRDAERLKWSALGKVMESLRARGVPEDVINAAVQEVVSAMPDQL